MFTTEALKELEQRKEALVAQSDIRRAMLELESARIQPYLGYIDTGVNFFKKSHPIGAFLTPLLGLWAARRLKKVADWIPSALLAWRAIFKGMALWRSFQQGTTPEDIDAPAASMFPERDS
jgi:hypothetical protein